MSWTMSPMRPELDFARPWAWALGMYPRDSAAFRTRSAMSGPGVLAEPFRTRLAVAGETPARRATSVSVLAAMGATPLQLATVRKTRLMLTLSQSKKGVESACQMLAYSADLEKREC